MQFIKNVFKAPPVVYEKTNVLATLQAGRGIAAMLVTLFHMTACVNGTHKSAFLGNIFLFGYSGVDYFFVLSGFIIAFSSRNIIGQRQNTFRYLLKRMVRIYPIYWITCAVFICIIILLPTVLPSGYIFAARNLLKTFLLWPEHYLLDGVSWTLSHEMYFYLLFALVIFSRKTVTVLLAVLLFSMINFGGELAGRHLFEGIYNSGIFFSPFNIEFFLGVLAAVLCTRINARIWKYLFCAGAIIFLFSGLKINAAEYRVFLYGVPSFLIILSLALLENNQKVKVPKILVMLGNASYSLYLIHQPLIKVINNLLVQTGHTDRVTVVFANIFFFGAVCTFAILTYTFVERPMTKGLNRLFRTSYSIPKPKVVTG